LVTDDRKRWGLHLEETIQFNLSLASLGAVAPHGILDAAIETQRNQAVAAALQIKTGGLTDTAGTLSGGNQQKVVIGKMLLAEPTVILLDEPTRGVDVGAKLEIYQLINRFTAEGKAVVLVSSELPELAGMSDRIVMLHEGTVGGSFNADNATQESLLAAAMGRTAISVTCPDP
jgi:D-xylose transport system ATP-binding protein